LSRRALLIRGLLLATTLAGLVACGMKGDPEPPAGEKVRFPRNYPK